MGKVDVPSAVYGRFTRKLGKDKLGSPILRSPTASGKLLVFRYMSL
jgi:hypothetical protein